jgi:hypothetical protein
MLRAATVPLVQPQPGKADMLNRTHSFPTIERVPPGQRREFRKQNKEILSLTLDFWRETLLLRTPQSVASLDELVEGFGAYTNYRRTGRGPVGRNLVRLLDLAYMSATRRLKSVRTSTRFADRCERQLMAMPRHYSLGEPSCETVLFTLMFKCDAYYGPHSELVRTLLERYRLAGSSGTALLAAPQWFYESMLVLWPRLRWGRQDVLETYTEIRAAGLHAGMSPEYMADGVDIDALVLLWDDDPLQLYFGLDDVLPALARL